jgi:lipid II isoglutaminyl synthase (glutamine-hydrolysing)
LNKITLLRTIAVLALCKLTIKFLRMIKQGGTTLPGKLALFLSKDILEILAKRLDTLIVVTGTNGKTTTCKMISKILSTAQIPFFSNPSGANLSSGVLTTLLENISLSLRFKHKIALLEMDEAAFGRISQSLDPRYVVITNFFRDQLDRFGELYTTVLNVKEGIRNLTSPTLIINTNDSLSVSVSQDTEKNSIFYGFSAHAALNQESSSMSDAGYCIYCKTKYQYHFKTFGHLGDFICENCNYKAPAPSVVCSKIEEQTTDHSKFTISYMTDGQIENLTLTLPLPGAYNIYNAISAAALCDVLDIPRYLITKGLENVESGFGRMETIKVGTKNITLILVKNPTGFSQVIQFLLNHSSPMSLAVLINDNLADGTDISWLWDVDFESLTVAMENMTTWICSGKRAQDMVLRLKYADIPLSKIQMEPHYPSVIEKGLSSISDGQTFYILPTYTAMLDIRATLGKKLKLKEIWK